MGAVRAGDEQVGHRSSVARQLGRNRETIITWISGIEKRGLKGFLEASCQACKKPRPKAQVDALVKAWVWEIREREEQCCGQKIAYFLEREHDVTLSVPKIYEVLSEKYQLRPKRRKNQARGAEPQASAARQVVQIDSVDFGHVFAFTAVDIWSREVDVLLRPSLNSQDGVLFLRFCMGRRFGHVGLLQCDGGSEWKGEFPLRARLFCDRLRIARPYKKNEQSFIESFNRTLRKECLGWGRYQPQQIPCLTVRVEAFLKRYHYHRPHLAFKPMRPPLDTA